MAVLMSMERESRELLRAVARRPADGDDTEFAEIVSGIRDWDALIRVARKHRILPRLFLRLANQSNTIPATTLECMRADYDRNAFHSLANAAELIAVLKEFDEQKIQAMPFKGVVLGASIYNDLLTRTAGDLDVLVFHRDLARATAALVRRGYELKTEVLPDGSPRAENYFEYHFERESDGMVIELRWRLELTQPKFGRNLGMDWVWPRRRTTKLAGAEVPDMEPAITLLVLCMHGSKHFWSRLIWICDVADLLAANPELDWKDVLQEAKRNGLWRALGLGVLLARKVANAPVPERVLQDFEFDSSVRALAKHISENIFDSPGSIPRSRVPYNIRLLGFTDRVRFFFSPSLFRPNERDRAAIALPRILEPLYYLVRPIRILRDRSSR
jgi:Uncharacterised nucleotidyltransferase